MNHFIIGTAGHIDHGKSTLIQALTGMITDTAPEEKERGLTINLGFAYLDLNNGERAGIIDVPGHERFVKNMLSGAVGIDLCLLVIDANEGIMPQTKEHAAILELLGITNYIIVLSKVSTVDSELLELVKLDIEEQFEGTLLENAPLIETDALSGLGIEALKQLIQDESKKISRKASNLPGRLNVDRAFSVKGVGTIVTGTLIEGSFRLGEEVLIYPIQKTATIRSIQIHEQDEVLAEAGNRTALNLAGVSLAEVERGSIITASPLSPSYLLDIKLSALADNQRPIELWDRVHVHIGSREVLARVVPLGIEAIMPGDTAFVQLRLEEQVTVKVNDHLIIRHYSPTYTIGGGYVLDANPMKHKRFDEEVLTHLQVREKGDPRELMMTFLLNRTYGFSTKQDIADYLNEEVELIDSLITQELEQANLIEYKDAFMAMTMYEELQAEVLEALSTYHEDNPLQIGMPREELRGKFSSLSIKEFDYIIEDLLKKAQIKYRDDHLALADYSIKLSSDQEAVLSELRQTLLDSGLNPPSIDELVENNPEKQGMMTFMKQNNELRQIDRTTVINAQVYEAAKAKVIQHIQANGSITLADFRDITQTSRKVALRFLEYLDRDKVTVRVGDHRQLTKKYQ